MREQSFQKTVGRWVVTAFGNMSMNNLTERCYRFLEEAVELVQAFGLTKEQAIKIVDYVYGRSQGEPESEVGGVLVTLAALYQSKGIDMERAGDKELDRIWLLIEQIRRKQADKKAVSAL